MLLGIVVGPVFPGGGEDSSSQAVENGVKFATAAKEAGLDGIFCANHFVTGPSQRMLNPLGFLPYVAGRCEGMYVGTSILVLPMYHPVLLAEYAATLDQLSNGRLVLGVGQGYRQAEFDSFGLDRSSRGDRTYEAIAAMTELFKDEERTASFAGEYYQFEDVGLSIAPAQTGGPPIMVAADTPVTVQKVGNAGLAWLVSPRHSMPFLDETVPMYREALQSSGYDFKGLPVMRELSIGTSYEDAVERMRNAFQSMYELYVKWGQPGEDYSADFDALIEQRAVLGSPEKVAEELVDYHNEYGADFVWFRLYWPGMDIGHAVESIRSLGEEVAPLVRREVGLESRLLGGS